MSVEQTKRRSGVKDEGTGIYKYQYLRTGYKPAQINCLSIPTGRSGPNSLINLTNGEVQECCYPEMEDREVSARCQTAVPVPVPDPGSEPIHGRLIRYQV
uniref:Uncharacterized protein n=1 Tax=Oryza glumipatula TaxID=40148 RepID=A0A0D9Z9W6_9ORYZ